eukprot:1142940-Pelagomonas_calceolata.AAC.1
MQFLKSSHAANSCCYSTQHTWDARKPLWHAEISVIPKLEWHSDTRHCIAPLSHHVHQVFEAHLKWKIGQMNLAGHLRKRLELGMTCHQQCLYTGAGSHQHELPPCCEHSFAGGGDATKFLALGA